GFARLLDAPAALFAEPPHLPQPDPNRGPWLRPSSAPFGSGLAVDFDGAIPAAAIDAHRAHLDAVLLRVLEDRRRRVEPHRLAVHQRGGELRGVMHLDPRAGVHEEREARGVALGEAVLGEALDLRVEPVGELPVDAALGEAAFQALA